MCVFLLTALGHKEPLELVGGNQQNRELDCPENQVADHALGGDADALRDVVGDVQIGRPDGSDDLGHGGGSSIGLDGMPEERGDGTDDDSEATGVEAEAGPHGHGEGNVQPGADHSVEDKRDRAGQAAKDDADDSLTPNEKSE